MSDAWRDIPGYEGIYAISDCGMLKTAKNRVKKPYAHKSGYLVVDLYRDRRRKKYHVHRLVLHAFKGPAPDGYQVNHRNGDTHDNALRNLEYVTPQRNIMHKRHVLHAGAMVIARRKAHGKT